MPSSNLSVGRKSKKEKKVEQMKNGKNETFPLKLVCALSLTLFGTMIFITSRKAAQFFQLKLSTWMD